MSKLTGGSYEPWPEAMLRAVQANLGDVDKLDIVGLVLGALSGALKDISAIDLAVHASKAALAQLTKSAALDWGAQGIRFNCIAPGSTDTPMLRRVLGAH